MHIQNKKKKKLRREKPVKMPDSVLKSVDSDLIKKYQMTRKWDEKLGFEDDKGSEENCNQNNTNNVENNNATMDNCGEDCIEALTVEKAGECLSFPRYVVGETELEALKEGRTLKDFKYGCVGYSVYLDNKDSSTDKMDKEAELPFCVGLEVIFGFYGVLQAKGLKKHPKRLNAPKHWMLDKLGVHL
ncbi:hypothetical protein Pint_31645 [Pistacia integerrima]|uniref:Uncharacterized protein n=1 Tax=Pistacia integerrima TaxID=434235 RepID=A0ACC0XQZ1_9ROSI|nr:hypothetical protein Pint_31645 [Pistacia integerrima]